MAFSVDEIDRYDRQILLPEWGAAGQERVRAARVAVAGTGPAAASAVRYLVAAGVGRVATDLAKAADDLNPHVSIVEGAVPRALAGRLGDPPISIFFPAVSGSCTVTQIHSADDRESAGAACAVEALKAILGLPHQTRVQLPSMVSA